MYRKKLIGFVGNPVLMLAAALAATAAEDKPSAENSQCFVTLVISVGSAIVNPPRNPTGILASSDFFISQRQLV